MLAIHRRPLRRFSSATGMRVQQTRKATGRAAERKRLLDRWTQEVESLPR